MESMLLAFAILLLGMYSNGEPEERKTLNEIIDATLNSKFDEIFTGEDNTATALDMLKYSIQETTIEPAYLAKVFYEAFDVTSEAELDDHKFKLEDAVDMMNKVIKHFQKLAIHAGKSTSPVDENADQSKLEL